MTEIKPFAIRSNAPTRFVGAFVAVTSVGGLVVQRLVGVPPTKLGVSYLVAALWVPLGTLLALDVSRIDVEPTRDVLTRRKGYWPFVRASRRDFAEIAELAQDVVKRRRGRARLEYDFNRLRIVFADGEAWDALEEFHRGTKVRSMAERLSALTGAPLTSA